MLWCADGDRWRRLHDPEVPGNLADCLLSAELAGTGRSLSIQHLSDGRWLVVETADDGGTGQLVRRVEHLSVLEGWRLAYDVFYDIGERPGGGFCHYRQVAQIFRGLMP